MAAGCSFDGAVNSQSGGQDSDGAVLPGEDGAVEGGEDGSTGDPDAGPGDPDAQGPPAYSLRVNLGGEAHVGTEYLGTWLADDGSYCGGNPWQVTAAIHNTVDDPLFQTNVYGIFACSFGEGRLPPGDYGVTLLFGEVHRGLGCPSSGTLSRIYDVWFEGNRVLQNFDVVSTNGGCVASTTSTSPVPVNRFFTTTVTDGTLNIETTGGTNGMISAVQIQSIATTD